MDDAAKRYEFPTGNIEMMIRVQAGEPLPAVMEDIGARWKPGNEHLWDEYDVESLIDSDEKRQFAVNQLLYSRISVYRALKDRGVDTRDRDPFAFAEQVPDLFDRLRDRFAHTLGGREGDGPA
jgi:hypothetical protein